jgi:hypothetical protein
MAGILVFVLNFAVNLEKINLADTKFSIPRPRSVETTETLRPHYIAKVSTVSTREPTICAVLYSLTQKITSVRLRVRDTSNERSDFSPSHLALYAISCYTRTCTCQSKSSSNTHIPAHLGLESDESNEINYTIHSPLPGNICSHF